MIIAEYTLDHPILRRTLAAAPVYEVEWEASYGGPDERPQFIAWVDSDDFEAFESAVRADPPSRRPLC